jgi:hypothetical protein
LVRRRAPRGSALHLFNHSGPQVDGIRLWHCPLPQTNQCRYSRSLTNRWESSRFKQSEIRSSCSTPRWATARRRTAPISPLPTSSGSTDLHNESPRLADFWHADPPLRDCARRNTDSGRFSVKLLSLVRSRRLGVR